MHDNHLGLLVFPFRVGRKRLHNNNALYLNSH